MSIRLRLTLWYVGLLTVILIAFGLILYSVLARNLVADVDRTLQAQATQVITRVEAENDPLQALWFGLVTIPSADAFATSGIYVEIMAADGRVVTQSANLGARHIPVSQAVFDRALRGYAIFHTTTVDSTRLRVHTAPITIGGQIIGVVQVARSLADVDVALRNVRTLLIGGIGAVVLLAALVGAFLARAALRPIDEITRTAREISEADDLERRIKQAGPQDEVGRLVSTFNAMLERLERLFKAQQRLIADVSHELRTPLTTVRGNLDLLQRGAAADPQTYQEVLTTIESEVARMARMVADLLFLAQADAGLTLKMQRVELDTLLLDVYRQAQVIARERGGNIAIRLGHEDQAVIEGDPDRLRQLLLNLVDNAIKYTPAGGEVKLSLYHEPGWVQVAVADTGVGIAPEDLPHIFERFYRSDRVRSNKDGGAGLGLAIARWIAEAHGGHLTAESIPGRGSTFTLWLPSRSRPPFPAGSTERARPQPTELKKPGFCSKARPESSPPWRAS